MALDSQQDGISGLPILAERRIPHAVKFPFAKFCHQHDLLAIVTETWEVTVFRIVSSHVAFVVQRKDDECEVTALGWKPDGSALAVAWNDGTYDIYSGEDGKLVKQAETGDGQSDDETEVPRRVVQFGWMTHRSSNGSGERKAVDDVGPTTEDWYNGLQRPITPGTGHIAETVTDDLTRAITNLDSTKTMPRLSAIPAHGMPYHKAGPAGSKFSTQVATDAIFEASKDSFTHSVEVLLVCWDDGTTEILQDETVKVGSAQLGGRPFLHAASARSPQHAFIAESADHGTCLSVADLPLETLGSPLVHVIATNTKRIQNLFEYTRHTVNCIDHDFTTGLQLPTRLMNSLNGMLAEKEQMEGAYQFYHSATTGQHSEVLLEWLVDILKDTNHKRWDQSVRTMYNNMQNHIFAHLLPALDRLSIAVTILRGHAKFHEGSTKFDCPPQIFTNILNGVNHLRTLAHQMQLIIMTEHQQFRAFSKWLKLQVEIGHAEPYSTTALETEEREVPSLDYARIRAYTKETLKQSKLTGFIPPTLAAMREIDGHVRLALKQVMSWQSRNLSPAMATLGAGGVVTDMQSDDDGTIRILSVHADTGEVEVIHAIPDRQHQSGRGHHNTRPSILVPASLVITTERSQSPATHTLLDAKFLATDGSYLALTATGDGQDSVITYVASRDAPDPADSTPMPSQILHTFPHDPHFKPERLIVGGRRGKQVCVVFAAGGRAWQVLDLEAGSIKVADAEELQTTDPVDLMDADG